MKLDSDEAKVSMVTMYCQAMPSYGGACGTTISKMGKHIDSWADLKRKVKNQFLLENVE